jgi:hypothetical protein
MPNNIKEFGVYDAASRTLLEAALPSRDAARDRFGIWSRDAALSDDAPKRSLHVVSLPAYEPPQPTMVTGHAEAQAVESRARLDKLEADRALEAADRAAVDAINGKG